MSIGKLGASASQLEYYERQVAAGAEGYFAGRGEVPGAWIGTGTGSLGLQAGGRVSRDGFMALMAGAHPVDGSLLRRMTERLRVAAIDLTFSAPKSVSVLTAVCGGEVSDALVQAHERAVSAPVGYLEREACLTRRGHGGVERAPGEGRFTALDARALFAHKSAAGAVYRAVLRSEARERLPWVSWSRVGRGLFEIDGVPAEVLRHFSQRRVEIEQRAAELAGTGLALSREAMQTIALAPAAGTAAARGGVRAAVRPGWADRRAQHIRAPSRARRARGRVRRRARPE